MPTSLQDCIDAAELLIERGVPDMPDDEMKLTIKIQAKAILELSDMLIQLAKAKGMMQ
jgi:hypothetical protein